MPRLRRRRPERHSPHDCPRTRERLLSGHDFDFLDGPDLTEDQLREAWQDLREDLLDEHLADHPGTRPWAWWRWEAAEPRRQVGDGREPVPDSPLWFGKPRLHRGMPPDTMYETESAYLARLGRLVGGR